MTETDEEPEGRALGGVARSEKLSPERKREIAKMGAAARWRNADTSRNEDSTVDPAALMRSSGNAPVTVQVECQREIDGIGMGVLSNGIAFLTGRGLAVLCGVHSRTISEMAAHWSEDPSSRMIEKIRNLLERRGRIPDKPYIEVRQRSGISYAYPDIVCLAVLEYYAFDAPLRQRQAYAKSNYRLLAGKALQDFIYTQVGYDPEKTVPDVWKQFHDRVSLTYNSLPRGYFGVFKELSDMIVTLGQAGLQIDSSFVPDISVGAVWGNHWKDSNLDAKYGERQKWDHNYPSYFRQAASNPQSTWCYPDSALGEFRRWLREDYIGNGKFAMYISEKAKQKELPVSFAQLAIATYEEGNAR